MNVYDVHNIKPALKKEFVPFRSHIVPSKGDKLRALRYTRAQSGGRAKLMLAVITCDQMCTWLTT